MFNKNFYSLKESALMLNVDEETLLHMHVKRKISLSIFLKWDYYSCCCQSEERLLEFIRVFIENIEFGGPILYSRGGFYDLPLLDGESVVNVKGEIFDVGVDLSLESIRDNKIPFPYLQGTELRQNGKVINYILHNNDRYVPIDWLVITHDELNRIKNIKDLIDKTPSYQQLQTENEVLKQRIAKLEAKQSTYSTEPNATSKASINAFFKALNASYGKILDVPRIIKAAEELGEKISDKTIYKYLDKGV